MRQHASVFTLLARSTVYKLLGIFAGLLLAETALFFLLGLPAGVGIEKVLGASGLRWVFAGALLLVSLLLSTTGTDAGGKSDYTLRRLSVSRRALFLWQVGYNFLVFLVLWAVQALFAYGLCLLCVEKLEITSSQAILLAFYRDDFLHALLPLDEVSLTVRNLIYCGALAVACACHPVRQRRGRNGLFPVIALAAAGGILCPSELGSLNGDVMAVTACVFAVFICLTMTWGE